MSMKEQRKTPLQTSLRLDAELKIWIEERAKRNDRSVNAEVNRLMRMFKENEQKAVAA